MVVLPLPVGPVTRMMPLVRERSRSMEVTCCVDKPISEREMTPRLLVEKTQHHPLTEKGGDDGDADVHVAAGHDNPEPAVLGEPLFGDIEAGHDLDAGNQGFLHDLRRGKHLVENAVDPEPDLQFPLERLDMDIARPFLDRLEQDGVQEADDRRLIGQVEEVLRLVEVRWRWWRGLPLPALPPHPGPSPTSCA